MKVEEIAEAVAKLPPDQLARFRRWHRIRGGPHRPRRRAWLHCDQTWSPRRPRVCWIEKARERTERVAGASPSPPLDFLTLKNRKSIHHQIQKFSEIETRISIDWCANWRQVTVLSKGMGRGLTTFRTLFGRGLALLVVCCLFVVWFTARKTPYTPQDWADLNRRPDATASRCNAASVQRARNAAMWCNAGRLDLTDDRRDVPGKAIMRATATAYRAGWNRDGDIAGRWPRPAWRPHNANKRDLQGTKCRAGAAASRDWALRWRRPIAART